MTKRKLCNEKCNECLSKNPLYKPAYFILAKLERSNEKVYPLVQRICPNLTCCPECHVDDFTHVEGCKIEKELKKK